MVSTSPPESRVMPRFTLLLPRVMERFTGSIAAVAVGAEEVWEGITDAGTATVGDAGVED
jgi:hypothetical protein